MQEPPAARVAPDAAVAGPEVLTAEKIDRILADFRGWLQDIAAAGQAPVEIPHQEAMGLQALVGQFVALRHDVNLQTKAARAQQEQASRSLEALEQALENLQGAETDSDNVAEEAVAKAMRPLLKSILDVTDLMKLAEREVERVRELLRNRAESIAAEQNDPKPRSWLHRLFRHEPKQDAASNHAREPAMRLATDTVYQLVESILAGYTMSLERLDRTLEQLGLDAIPSEGRSFDPELMEVVDAVAETGLPPGEVVEEVRPGYLWRGRVFRFAQVKVAKS
jgi:molecular chaperone GrpE